MKKKYTASFKAPIVQEILNEEKTMVQIDGFPLVLGDKDLEKEMRWRESRKGMM